MTDPYRCPHCGASLASADDAACAECVALAACNSCGVSYPRHALYLGCVGLECGTCEDRRVAGAEARDRTVGISEGRAAYLLSMGVTR